LAAGAGSVRLFYAVLDMARILLTVPPGGTIDQAVDFTSVDRFGRSGTTVKLDAFVISSNRE